MKNLKEEKIVQLMRWLFANFSFKNSFIQMKNIQNGNQQSSLSHKKNLLKIE